MFGVVIWVTSGEIMTAVAVAVFWKILVNKLTKPFSRFWIVPVAVNKAFKFLNVTRKRNHTFQFGSNVVLP